MVKNYDCNKKFIFNVGVENRFDELELAQISLNTAKNVELRDKDYDNAFEILMKALLCTGNALLIYKFKMKSKSKGCQFQYLYQEGVLSQKQVERIGYWFEWRNHIYYNDVSAKFPDMDEELFNIEKEKVLEIINYLRLRIEK